MAKAKVEKVPLKPEGMVLFTDGSVRPVNPGYGGWGMHGYAYMKQTTKKGNGNALQMLTEDGYVEKITIKDSKPIEVKALSYVDAFGSFNVPVSNNHAEIAGVANGFEYCDKYDVKKLTILTDSEYAIKGTTTWLPTWKKNNWIKRDGTPVANKDAWLQLESSMDKLKAKGVEIEVKWVKGHSTHLGNILADKHARIGSSYAIGHQLRTEFNTADAEGYWTDKPEKHPFICQRRIYFTTVKEINIPGEYYLGEHGKDDELIGNRQTDGVCSYVELKKPEPLIELLRNKQCCESSNLDSIIMGRLDAVFESKTATDLLRFGEICLSRPFGYKLDLHLFGDDKSPMTKELKPPRLAMRILESLNMLKGTLQSWQDKQSDNLTETNITELLFTIDSKGEYKLNDEFVPGYTSLPANLNYGKDNLVKKVDMCLGVDLPDRNTLKRLEKLKPQVIAVSWMESDKAFRYATIIKEGENFGIWAGMYSNLRFII